jgi:hypothetical protein
MPPSSCHAYLVDTCACFCMPCRFYNCDANFSNGCEIAGLPPHTTDLVCNPYTPYVISLKCAPGYVVNLMFGSQAAAVAAKNAC